MASISKYKAKGNKTRWRLHWRSTNGRQETRSFVAEGDAKRWKAQIERATLAGTLDETLLELKGIVMLDAPVLNDLIEIWWNDWATSNLTINTQKTYRAVYEKWIGPYLGETYLVDLELPAPILRWRQSISANGAGDEAVIKAKTVLSSALTYGVEFHPEMISVNGALRMSQSRRRTKRSVKSADTGAKKQIALSPLAIELMRLLMLEGVGLKRLPKDARPYGKLLNATALSLIAKTGCRTQDLWGLTWDNIGKVWIDFEKSLTSGKIDYGKTGPHSTKILSPLDSDLAVWRKAQPADDSNPYVFPGDHENGHFTEGQFRSWRSGCWTKTKKELVRRLEEAQARPTRAVTGYSDTIADLKLATPYACRRGFITVALRANMDVAEIANWCGTSPDMIFKHYYKEIRALRDAESVSIEDAFSGGREEAESLFSLI